MAKRFHVGKSGPGECRAKPGNCPLEMDNGEPSPHFDTISEAQELFDQKMEQEAGLFGDPQVKELTNDESDLKRRTFTIPTIRTQKAEEKIERLNRRLEKAGSSEKFEFTREDRVYYRKPTEHEIETYGFYPGESIEVRESTYVLNRPKIAVGDWEFQAAFDRVEGSDDFTTRSVKGVDLGGWTPEPGVCDHCKQKRHRNKTYLIKNREDGSTMTIGSACIKPFMGEDPNLWSFNIDARSIADDEMRMQTEPEPVMDNREIIARALAVSDGGKYFVSRSSANYGDKTATIDSMGIFNENHSKLSRKEQIERQELVRKAYEYLNDGTVDKVLESASRIKADSDYGRNVSVILKHGRASRKRQSTLISVISHYRREQAQREREELQKTIAPEQPKGFVGKEKERVRDMDITVTNVYNGTRMGYGYNAAEEAYSLVTARTADNKEVVWVQGGKTVLAIGDKAKLTGTVKSHKKYKGNDQTNFTRVNAEKVPEKDSDGFPKSEQLYAQKPLTRNGAKVKKTRAKIEQINSKYVRESNGFATVIARTESNHRISFEMKAEDLEKVEEGAIFSVEGKNSYNDSFTSHLAGGDSLKIEFEK